MKFLLGKCPNRPSIQEGILTICFMNVHEEWENYGWKHAQYVKQFNAHDLLFLFYVLCAHQWS